MILLLHRVLGENVRLVVAFDLGRRGETLDGNSGDFLLLVRREIREGLGISREKRGVSDVA
jgi:hypothetical protein